MARLLDLPDELILSILSILVQDYAASQKLSTFNNWAREYEQTSTEAHQLAQQLYSLPLSCRRLANIVTSFLYRDVWLNRCCRGDCWKHPRLEQSTRSLRDNRNLGQFIVSVAVPCGKSITSVLPLFWLPNIHTLTLFNFEDEKAPGFEDYSHEGTSPVKVLCLIECCAEEAPLAAVLSWPQKLDELHYDVEQYEWSETREAMTLRDWECDTLVRSLQPQKESLQCLTFTRASPEGDRLRSVRTVNLKNFVFLKTLRIYQVFLISHERFPLPWARLPRNLEVLEIYHDDTDDIFTPDHEEDPYIIEIARHKEQYLPMLRKVTVGSWEDIYGDNGQEIPLGLWTPSTAVSAEFERAQIELTIFID
ncbi:hypothetical protein VTN00DRAFT_3967 [Thermoascus crustaceus]|uniref:uncharacterized protein n=1 Tax=Thermoascus crustaceus TaxID=5088 RepID=UPI00374310D8